MRIVLKVSSSNEYCNGGCDFALVDVTGGLVALVLKRVELLKEQKTADPDIDEIYYWDYSAQYFSPWAAVTNTDESEGAGRELADLFDELQREGKGCVVVAENFQVPASLLARVECQQMVVRQDSIAFSAIPKHASFYIYTQEIPFTTLEAATALSPRV